MKIRLLTTLTGALIISLNACINNHENVAMAGKISEPTDYIAMLEELHDIECSHLKKEKIEIKDTAVYTFRALAFQAVMKNKDRKVLARYEDLYQKLADLEHNMDEAQLGKYNSDIQKVYQSLCK